ncbi:condensation domain-containing protein [Saccharothrix variisporea]|uniref:Condensation domain-containing protein n=1 Tax=Saccharothrix variisporea TaxID=543527 RepID=A0A495X6Q5_9PSEU|nr:condensation domain-containing protein [Saccharothrix variisporea]RKT69226.1 condensation domain-containing protein [Saccharothrix variisporea]
MRETEGAVRYPLTLQLTMCCINEAAGQDMLKYTMPIALRITGRVDSAALRGALDDLVVRHESLRTVITCGCEDDGGGFQTVRPAEPVPFTEHRLVPGPGRSREDLAEDVLAELFTQTMSRYDNPLLRAALHRFDDGDSVLALLTHHIAGDALSTGVLRRDLAAFYRARTTGTEPELPPVRQYGEYARWQRARWTEARVRAVREYWAENLAGAQVFAPPADRAAGTVASGAPYGTVTFDLDPREMGAVRAVARGARGSTWHVLVAAAALLATGLTGRTDPALMAVRAPRDHPSFDDTVGLFVDALPLRVDLDGCVTFRDVLLRARSTCMRSYRNPLPNCDLERHMPEFLEPNRDPANVPIFFNYLASVPKPEEIPFADGAERVAFRDEIPLDRGGICVWGMWELPSGGLRAQFEYPPDRLDAATAERWTNGFRDLVLRLACTPDEPWGDAHRA